MLWKCPDVVCFTTIVVLYSSSEYDYFFNSSPHSHIRAGGMVRGYTGYRITGKTNFPSEYADRKYYILYICILNDIRICTLNIRYIIICMIWKILKRIRAPMINSFKLYNVYIYARKSRIEQVYDIIITIYYSEVGFENLLELN